MPDTPSSAAADRPVAALANERCSATAEILVLPVDAYSGHGSWRGCSAWRLSHKGAE